MKNHLSRAVDKRKVPAANSGRAAGARRGRLLALVVGLCSVVMALGAHASFQVVDDFDSLALGNVDGQNGWVLKLTGADVVKDPADGDNQVLSVSTDSGVLRKAQSIADKSVRMLFLRLRFDVHGRYSFGFSPLQFPDEFSDFSPELGMAAETAGDPNNEIRVANGLTTEVYDVLETLRPGVWHNIWVLIDNNNKTYQVWMNSVRGRDARESDKLTNSAGESVFGFRTSGSDLLNFFIKTGGGAGDNGPFYLDDIYLEDSAAINLINPTPAIDMSWWPPLQYVIDQ